MKKLLLCLVAFAVIGVCVFAAASAADKGVGLPQPITAESPCPAVGCASGQCHGFDSVPQPDGVHEMVCPEAGCASVECHAWDTLTGRYHQASDASLNLWILAPVVFVVGLVALVKKA